MKSYSEDSGESIPTLLALMVLALIWIAWRRSVRRRRDDY